MLVLRILLAVVAMAGLAEECAADAAPDRDAITRFVEAEMRAHRVPGAAIAVIRSNRIDWTAGFGVANTLTREPVTPDTAFPVASNGEPVLAWLAAYNAGRDVIALDQPVLAQAAIRMPHTAEHERITPLHLLMHASGLGNFVRDQRRPLSFSPGARFGYSGVGFVVLQELLEKRSRTSIDALAAAQLFAPLGMQHSWYGNRPRDNIAVAAPHMAARHTVMPFLIAAVPIATLLVLLCLVCRRMLRGNWRLPVPAIAVVACVAAGLSFVFLVYKSGTWLLATWFTLVPVAAIAAGAAIIVASGRIARANPRVRALAHAVAALGIVAVAFAVRDANIPLPAGDTAANAASSMRSTAPDLARFLIEVSNPSLSLRTAQAMTTERRRIDDTSAWGLGIGIEPHARGRDLWHWGSNPGAKSLMVISPETGAGVVVVTNGVGGSQAMRAIAAKVLGREGCWQPACAAE